MATKHSTDCSEAGEASATLAEDDIQPTGDEVITGMKKQDSEWNTLEEASEEDEKQSTNTTTPIVRIFG
jgi:hypothetical protein